MTSSEVPRIFLHIGANKTGTTALQHVFARSDNALRSAGLLYAATGRGTPEEGGNSHIGLASALGFDPGRRTMSEAAALQAALHAEIAASGCRDVVISAEYFMLRRDIAPVAAFLAPYDAKVVVYLRRHDEWLEALVAQALLTVDTLPWDLTVEGYLAHQQRVMGQYIDYTQLLDDWAAAFGASNIIVRPYERRGGAPDIAADFLGAIGRAELAPLVGAAPALNRSLPGHALKLIRGLRQSPLPGFLRQALVQIVMQGAEGASGGSMLTSEARAAILLRFAPQYEEIARTYLGRADGRLFSDHTSESAGNPTSPLPSALRTGGYLLRGVVRQGLRGSAPGWAGHGRPSSR